jgi:BlaI family penicillinase repressor
MTAKRATSKEETPKLPSISDAEWVVMAEFWRLGQATAREVVAALEGRQQWKPRTVQSLINRLVGKGALTFEQHGREYIYTPTVEESRCVHEASRSFVDRVFSGKLAPLLACFLEREKVSKNELEEIRKLLEENRP